MRRRAFSLPELAGITAVLVLSLAIASIGADRSRRLARCGEDVSHLRDIWAGTTSYAADFTDHVWQFSWTRTYLPATFSDLMSAGDDATACRQQFVQLMRTAGNRPTFPSIASVNLVVNPAYGHAVLLAYLGKPMPNRLFTSAGDYRALWADDPLRYDQGLFTPNLGTSVSPSSNWRHPYGGSFRMGAAFWDRSPLGTRVLPGGSTGALQPYPTSNFGPAPLTEVLLPSSKVFIHDTIARHFGRQWWHMDTRAKLPFLMCDGSASVRASSEANLGAHPNFPASASFTESYAPSAIDPPGSGLAYYIGVLWTRMGLAGRDFGGPDVYPSP
jgi:hypothetical protein